MRLYALSRSCAKIHNLLHSMKVSRPEQTSVAITFATEFFFKISVRKTQKSAISNQYWNIEAPSSISVPKESISHPVSLKSIRNTRKNVSTTILTYEVTQSKNPKSNLNINSFAIQTSVCHQLQEIQLSVKISICIANKLVLQQLSLCFKDNSEHHSSFKTFKAQTIYTIISK